MVMSDKSLTHPAGPATRPDGSTSRLYPRGSIGQHADRYPLAALEVAGRCEQIDGSSVSPTSTKPASDVTTGPPGRPQRDVPRSVCLHAGWDSGYGASVLGSVHDRHFGDAAGPLFGEILRLLGTAVVAGTQRLRLGVGLADKRDITLSLTGLLPLSQVPLRRRRVVPGLT